MKLHAAERILREKYRSVGLWLGSGELLLGYNNALNYISDCLALGLVISDMDFFIERDGRIGQLNQTLWGYEATDLTESIASARGLLKSGLPDGATHVGFLHLLKEDDLKP